MDLKPIVTNSGDEKLYVPLSKEIERRLPSKSVEWKRTYGRSTKTVCLKATFSKYSADSVGSSLEGNVTKQPFLHIYWTSCLENDEYRNILKQKITNWQQSLKARDISDWLIVQVVSTQDASKAGRTKLALPRSTVFDKIRIDLCGRNVSRCAQLWEPDKETLFTKSGESWESLLSQLRQLLLDSISRHLMKFEEKVRSQREKYSEADWSFIEYLKLNEELATIFKSVTLHEDALVQYDELDALFSQFVINGRIKGLPKWLKQFTEKPKCWDGISLNKESIKFHRDLVYNGHATLLELRNYIFIRQWQMLSKIGRSWDVAHRLLEFLFTVINEIKILEVDMQSYVPACWVISSCLEFLNIFEKREIPNHSTRVHLAQIYDYTREKLFHLGDTLMLLPGENTSQLNVENVNSGLCRSHQKKDDTLTGSKLLLIAISCKYEFEKLYLHVCETTKSIYTDVQMHRFSMKAAIDLGKFFLLKGSYEKAVTYLERALQSFGQSKWDSLHIDVLEPLAKCQAELQLFDRYLCSLALLSCAKSLSRDKQLYYSKEFLSISQKTVANNHIINTEPVLTLEHVKINLVKEIGHVGETVSVVLQLTNNLPSDFSADEIEIRMRYTQTNLVRLSEVDAGNDNRTHQSPIVKWSELFEKTDGESPSNLERKPGLLRRIRSRRTTKQNEANTPETNSKLAPLLENGDLIASERASLHTSLTERCDSTSKRCDSNTSNASKRTYDKRPSTLAEIAGTYSLGKEDSGEGINNEPDKSSFSSATELSSTRPVLNSEQVGLTKRCDSTSSCLSNVSIISDKSATSNGDIDEIPSDAEKKELPVSPLAFDSTDYGIKGNDSDARSSISNASCKSEGDDDANQVSDAERKEIQAEVTGSSDGLESRNSCTPNEEDEKLNLPSAIENGEEKIVNDDPVSECNNETGVVESTTEASSGADIPEELEETLEIEEEMLISPVQKLTCTQVALQPGRNSLELNAKVLHEGRYTLQSFSCKVGNLTLFHLLGLPRKSRAFFIVSDPPKFTWTATHLADYLLLGSKEKVHITLSNGPGQIAASSVVRISSSTGLEFSSVSPSSVYVYSANKTDDPKEGAMQIEVDASHKNAAYLYLPECGAYEMVDLFFDVKAPVENAKVLEHRVRHEVSLECLWLSDLVDSSTVLESIFYEPFAVSHAHFVSKEGRFVNTALRGLNPLQISIQCSELKCLNSENVTFKLVTCDVPMNIYDNEDLSLVWSVNENETELEDLKSLHCQLNVKFKTEKQDEFGSYSKSFEILNTKPLYMVTSCFDKGEFTSLYKGSVYKIEISINPLRELPKKYQTRTLLCVLEDNEQWKFNDEEKVKRFEITPKCTNELRFTSEVVPCVSGKVEHPQVSLLKETENKTDDKTSPQSKKNRTISRKAIKRLSSSRRTSSITSDDLSETFSSDEIIFSDLGRYLTVEEPAE